MNDSCYCSWGPFTGYLESIALMKRWCGLGCSPAAHVRVILLMICGSVHSLSRYTENAILDVPIATCYYAFPDTCH